MKARRDILKGASLLPLSAILANPALAKMVADGVEMKSLNLESGRTVKAGVALPAVSNAPSVILIHEWWGLNDQILSVAADFARQGYLAVAVDLYGGNVATTPDEARANMKAVKASEAEETLKGWMEWAKNERDSSGKVGTVGWCFGGGWSLNASIAAPVDATVIYYGNVTRPASDLKKLKGPVQGHFATKDKWINKEMVAGFEAAMKEAGRPDPETYWYEADHAFANPSGGRFDAEDAQLAWTRTMDFLGKNLA
ncbi:dienelactone hydrolase family protein [Sneathiella sp. P13V-1]|uniref:dienelactone hydrolase family protein n=1 Tax=Sneathiella sp. P13V-1 TaxID=2697366 RepID=UPI00187BBE43|nr:dienelactone hydrolase family protein [Sneathiella sp. P13V-1]MBE7638473.1 dienelactone hydrolase family protein [Sneathiella sp. P13V-1]